MTSPGRKQLEEIGSIFFLKQITFFLQTNFCLTLLRQNAHGITQRPTPYVLRNIIDRIGPDSFHNQNHNNFYYLPICSTSIDEPRPLINDLWVFPFQKIDAECINEPVRLKHLCFSKPL